MADTTSNYTWLSPEDNHRDTLARAIKELGERDLLRIDTNKGGGIGFRGSLEELFHLQNLLDLNDITTSFATTPQNLEGVADGIILRVISRDTDPVLSLLQEHVTPDWNSVPIVNQFRTMELENVAALARKHGAARDDDYQITHVASADRKSGILPKQGEFINDAGPENNYLAMGPNGVTSWVYFKAQKTENGAEAIPPTTGWKLHISASTVEAQEKLAELAMDYKITEFKFAPEKWFPNFLNPEYHQCGKTAVFYHTERGTHGQEIDWEGFIREAEKIVMKHGGPGPAVQRDRTIPGSQAVHYRNDRGANGEKYVPRAGLTGYMQVNGISESQSHNLAGLPDPFKHIQLREIPSPPVTDIDDDVDAGAEKELSETSTNLPTPPKPQQDTSGAPEQAPSSPPVTPTPGKSERNPESKQGESGSNVQETAPSTSNRGKIAAGLAGAAGVGLVGTAASWRQRVQRQNDPKEHARLTKRTAVFATVTAIAVGAALAVTLGMGQSRSR